ncbi:MAG: TrkA C-terminal domain-containing protein, partial [Kiritimatiellia bacterium]
NSSPGLEGIEAATHLDVAGSIIDHIADQVNMPDLDIRQKLTVSRGYNVSEIAIPEGSVFVGQSIEETGLRNRDIVVLTLKRGTTVISNPKNSRIIEPGDELLCYGKTESMKMLVTPKKKKRRDSLLPLSDDQIEAAREGSA